LLKGLQHHDGLLWWWEEDEGIVWWREMVRRIEFQLIWTSTEV
jgi:hypothetical protein